MCLKIRGGNTLEPHDHWPSDPSVDLTQTELLGVRRRHGTR